MHDWSSWGSTCLFCLATDGSEPKLQKFSTLQHFYWFNETGRPGIKEHSLLLEAACCPTQAHLYASLSGKKMRDAVLELSAGGTALVHTGSQITLLFTSSHIQREDVIEMATVVPQLRMLAWSCFLVATIWLGGVTDTATNSSHLMSHWKIGSIKKK